MGRDHRITASARRSVAAIAVLFTVDAGALAVVEEHAPRRFEHRILAREGGAIGVRGAEIGELDPADGLRVGWEEFGNRHGGWTTYLDERSGMPAMASGRGIPWLTADAAPEPGLDQLEALARTFLAEHQTLLGDWTGLLELDRAASGEVQNQHWQLVFRQVVDGVPVEDARFDLHVKFGRLVMFGATKWGAPAVSAVPSLDAEQAQDALDDYLGAASRSFEQVGEPELAILVLDPVGSSGEPRAWTGSRGEGLAHALIWRFRFREPGAAPLWVGEVDANDGTVRAFYDGAHYASARGGVFPASNDGECVTGGCEVAGFPLPFADYTESGQPEALTDTFGNLTCSNGSSDFETQLSGQYVHIADACGALSETGTCETGIDLGLKHGENCDVEPGASPGNSAAARTAYYHINRVAEAARFYDPANAWLQDQVTVNVNIASTCNANWNGQINMYGEGGGCGNTGEQQGVLVHEWGHGYDQNDGGNFDVPSEAYADVVAIFAARSSCMSRGWFNDGGTCTGYGDTCLTCTGIRDFDWAARQNNTPTTPSNFVVTCPSGGGGPCSREPHCESYPISETIFDLATRDLPAAGLDPDSAWQLAERLWYSTRAGSGGDVFNCFRLNLAHSCFATHWMQRMLVADDDDADLSNGTPHAAAIFAAFERHDISCGSASDLKNQSTSSCPSLAAPALSLTETPSGTELSWGTIANAGEYRIYRGELGCDRQQVPIASVPVPTTVFVDGEADAGLPRYYRVEAFGANPACAGPVSTCESTPLGARLQKYEHRFVEAGPVINGIPDPGETVQIPVTLLNTGLDSSFGTAGRLRLVDSSQGRILGPLAAWADVPPSDTGESDAPHFEMVVFETTACGDTLELELDAWASNATARRRAFGIPLGDRERDFVNGVSMAIPPQTTVPATSTLLVDQDHSVSELDVSIDLSHADTTELIVELSSPNGTTVRLHDQSDPPGSGIRARYDLDLAPDGPGSLADFVGESTLGTWTLAIEDVGPAANGTLTSWTLHFSVNEGFDCEPQTCAEPTPTTAVAGVVVDCAANDADLVLSWGSIAGVAGYHVLQSTDPSFTTAVDLAGQTAGGTTLTLPDGVDNTPDLTFFQLRATNPCHQEGP